MPTTRARRIVSGSPRGGTTGTTNLSTRFFFSFVLLHARHSLRVRRVLHGYNVSFYWRTRAHHVGAIRCSPRNAEEKLPVRQVFHTVFHRNCERSVTRDRWLT